MATQPFHARAIKQEINALALLLLVLPVLGLMSCKRTVSSGVKGYVSEGDQYIWPSKTIEVCWENPTRNNARGRELVREIVQQEYARAGFNFTGWSQCQSYSQGIRIFEHDNKDRSVEAFGRRLSGIPRGMKLNLTWKQVTWCQGREDICIKQDGLHEFGHALGLRHEGNRPDNHCALDQFRGQGEVGAASVAEYDEHSIMNYCANLAEREARIEPRLSDGDLKVLNFYYDQKGHGPSQSQCEQDANSWRVEPSYACCAYQSGNKRRGANERNFKYCDELEKPSKSSSTPGGGHCPDGDNGAGKGYGSVYQCGSNTCAKSDKPYVHECIIGSGGGGSGSDGGGSSDGSCPDGDNGPGRGYGQIFQCGSNECAKTDQSYTTPCTIGSSINYGGGGSGSGGSGSSDGRCPDGDNGPGRGYGQVYQCGSSQCAKTDQTYAIQCTVN